MNYIVTIRETLIKTVEIEADSPEEAEGIVSSAYRNGEYVLTAENFSEVEFDTAASVQKGEHLMDGKRKLEDLSFMLKFAEESFIGEEVIASQLRSLWTTYCLHHGLDIDAREYDDDLHELWNSVSLEEEETQNWSDFDSFGQFMCAWLV